jgi:hypothetical protein
VLSGSFSIGGDLHHTDICQRFHFSSGMVGSRQHPACVMAASSQPGALTRATSHEQMPAAVAVAVAIKGEADRVTREPSKGPLVTAPEISIQSF